MSMKTQNPAAVTAQFLEALTREAATPTLGVQQVRLLLALYTYGQLSQQALVEHTGVEKSSNSRNIAKLGDGESPTKEAGPGWVESFEDRMNRKHKMVRLTPRGKALIERVIEQVK